MLVRRDDCRYMERYNKSLARRATSDYVAVAAKYGMSPSELAIAWCRSRWGRRAGSPCLSRVWWRRACVRACAEGGA